MGERAKYADVYRRNRKMAVDRAGGRCVKCGAPFAEVHHVYGYTDNAVEHLQPLCNPCHLIAPMDEDYWTWLASGKDGLDAMADFVMPRVRAMYPHLNDAEWGDFVHKVLASVCEQSRS